MTRFDGRRGSAVSWMLFLWVCAFLGSALGQTQTPPPLSTNRPNQSSSPDTTTPGYVKFEIGWTLNHDETSSLDEFESNQFPGIVARIGVLGNLEAQIGWSGYSWQEVTVAGIKDEINGAGDGSFAMKWRIRDAEGATPAVALLPGVNLPFGKDALSSHRVDPSLLLLVDHTLSDRFTVSYNIGPSWATSETESGDLNTLSSLNYSLAIYLSATGNLGLFGEVFGSTALSDSGRAQNSIDTGFTYLISDKVIVDFIVGWGLSDAADDWFVGSGLTFRLPR